MIKEHNWMIRKYFKLWWIYVGYGFVVACMVKIENCHTPAKPRLKLSWVLLVLIHPSITNQKSETMTHDLEKFLEPDFRDLQQKFQFFETNIFSGAKDFRAKILFEINKFWDQNVFHDQSKANK